MEQNTIQVPEQSIHFSSGYGGNGAKCEIKIGEEWLVIELDHIKELLHKAIDSRGYTVSKTGRQKYPRLFIND